jgi:hypothetical protein
MRLDKDPFSTNMNMFRPSLAETTKGKEVIIGEEWPPRMINLESPKYGKWQRNEGGKSQRCPKATFDILMAKYKEGRAGVMGHENRTIRNPKPDGSVSWVRPATLQPGAHLANDLELLCIEIQKLRSIVSKSIIRHLTSRLGCQCLGHGGLHRWCTHLVLLGWGGTDHRHVGHQQDRRASSQESQIVQNAKPVHPASQEAVVAPGW